MDNKITVRPHPRCKYCMGSGKSVPIYAPVEIVCSCVTEQLRIVVQPVSKRQKPSVPANERHVPSNPEYVIEEITE